jgi:AraC family transcriptional regulator
MPPAPPATYAEHYRSSAYADFPQEHRCAGSAEAAVFRVRQQSHDFVDPPVAELVIAAAIETDMTFSWDIGDGWTAPRRVRGGSLHVLPAGTEARIRAQGAQDMIFLALPPGLLGGVLEPAGATAGDLARDNTDYFHDAPLVRRLLRLWEATQRASPAGLLETDALLLSILGRLLDRAGRMRGVASAPLSAGQMGVLDDLIEANLDTPLRIEELGSSLGLTRFHFCRAFRAATGQSPHQYVLARRVARAQALLADGKGPLADVAFACGFASQAHMTDVFRGRLGVTPGQYRRDMRD